MGGTLQIELDVEFQAGRRHLPILRVQRAAQRTHIRDADAQRLQFFPDRIRRCRNPLFGALSRVPRSVSPLGHWAHSGRKSTTLRTSLVWCMKSRICPTWSPIQFFAIQKPVDPANEGKELSEGLGDVQIVVHGVPPGGLNLVQGLTHIEASPTGLETRQPRGELIQPSHTLRSPLKFAERIVEHRAIMRGQQPVADRRPVETLFHAGVRGSTHCRRRG